MRLIFAVLLAGLLISPSFGANAWVANTSPTTQDLYDAQFVSSSTGYAVGGRSTVVKTTDYGKTWTKVYDVALNIPFVGMHFISSQIGYVVGNNLQVEPDVAVAYKTADGGSTWVDNKPVEGVINYLGDVFFVDENTGWWVGATADTNVWWKRNDVGGSARVGSVVNGAYTMRGVYFIDSQNGWVVGNSGTISRSTNGGVNWNDAASGTSNQLNDVFFINSTIGWVVGNSGTILKTINGGTAWTALTSGTANNLNAVHFVDASNGWAVGDSGTILKTTDGGTNWAAETSGTTNNLYGVHFTSATEGCAVGASGTILRYSEVPTITSFKRGRYTHLAQNSFNRSVTIAGTGFNNPAVTFDSGEITGGALQSSSGTEGVLPVSVTSNCIVGAHTVTVTNLNGAGANATYSFNVLADTAGVTFSDVKVNDIAYAAGTSYPLTSTFKATLTDVTGLSNDELDFNLLVNTTATARPPKYYQSFSAASIFSSTSSTQGTVNLTSSFGNFIDFETGQVVSIADKIGYGTTLYMYLSAKDIDGNEGTSELNFKLTGLQPGEKGITNIFQSPNKNPTTANPIVVKVEVKDPTLAGVKQVPIVGVGGPIARLTQTFVTGTNTISWTGETIQGGQPANGIYKMILPGGASAKIVVWH